MSNAIDPSFLANLAASYQQDDKPRPIIQLAKPVKVKSAKHDNSSEKSATPIAKKGEVVLSNLPDKGSLNGREFLLAVREAGKRPITDSDGTTRIVRDERCVREDVIRCIAGFIGYDFKGDFGAQEAAARQAAQRDLRPIIGEEYKRVLVPQTTAGYIAGSNDATAKMIADLKGRRRLTLDAISKHEQQNNDNFANLERARLRQIESDLATLQGT